MSSWSERAMTRMKCFTRQLLIVALALALPATVSAQQRQGRTGSNPPQRQEQQQQQRQEPQREEQKQQQTEQRRRNALWRASAVARRFRHRSQHRSGKRQNPRLYRHGGNARAL